jgi:hypothetical protein
VSLLFCGRLRKNLQKPDSSSSRISGRDAILILSLSRRKEGTTAKEGKVVVVEKLILWLFPLV